MSTAKSSDDEMLAELGYKAELDRSWSGFHNFAISFSVISILSGPFISFFIGWNNGGPMAISWGWPIVSALILIVGLCMGELVSAMPTSGGMYFWAVKLGSLRSSYFTGWLDFLGLLAIVAAVSYGAASFIDITISAYSPTWAAGYSLTRVFLIFIGVLIIVTLLSIFSSHLLAIFNSISVWWHVVGVAAVIAILIFIPDHHASVSDVFTQRINNTGMFGGSTSNLGFLFLVLPLSMILPQFTVTGYDASCHMSEETVGAAGSAAKGIWQAILYSAIGGWILLLSFLFAVQDPDAVSAGGGSVVTVLNQALGAPWIGIVLVISTVGQCFCAMACMTSTTRMLFAFSRDGAVPGARFWTRLNSKNVPLYSVALVAVLAIVLTLPALVEVDVNGAPVPVAFNAVVSIGVVGLYLAFAIPIYQRWRKGSAFKAGSWNLGQKYKWLCAIAVVEIGITTVIAMLPTSSGGVPWNASFEWKYLNYTPLVVGGTLLALWLAWQLRVKHTYTGPRSTINLPAGVGSADELEFEYEEHHPGHHHHGSQHEATAAAKTPAGPWE
ncbi:amino acid permease [Mycobacterium sp. 852013-50091_SCH5140682]|uniref:amino acid permease n=1 Tax=Mycobacterium sp. 852013-50091_SCH5140682 TaxID=1834109 RepID=UPI0007EAA720|nr:amino acid permease [Mycobacterium sp. 852013-50091_SCH5140682]OBC00137.1 amino acid permease [Mycobacterium sp. 852013-50091_SCH5140682]